MRRERTLAAPYTAFLTSLPADSPASSYALHDTSAFSLSFSADGAPAPAIAEPYADTAIAMPAIAEGRYESTHIGNSHGVCTLRERL